MFAIRGISVRPLEVMKRRMRASFIMACVASIKRVHDLLSILYHLLLHKSIQCFLLLCNMILRMTNNTINSIIRKLPSEPITERGRGFSNEVFAHCSMTRGMLTGCQNINHVVRFMYVYVCMCVYVGMCVCQPGVCLPGIVDSKTVDIFYAFVNIFIEVKKRIYQKPFREGVFRVYIDCIVILIDQDNCK
ncbi:unnamed protein product [Onchocerca flexuosa]|uniref:DNA-directed RNA polymerase n=1 Tax=Onchocerca flexuosa TaxID=387005 RepID=A0A183HGC0_9BILA|nr:unnamed protein product [Onchocerca flexuosa]